MVVLQKLTFKTDQAYNITKLTGRESENAQIKGFQMETL